MANTTNLHLLEKITKCLDCGSDSLVILGESSAHNNHYGCENCGAHFWWADVFDNEGESEFTV